MTQRALAASPLFMGGDLTRLPDEDLRLLTNPRMLACNQNGVSARLLHRRGDVEVRRAPHRTQRGRGWLGVFNRNPARRLEAIVLSPDRLGLPPGTALHEVWEDRACGCLGECPSLGLPPDDVVFLEHTEAWFAPRITTTATGRQHRHRAAWGLALSPDFRFPPVQRA